MAEFTVSEVISASYSEGKVEIKNAKNYR